MTDEVEKVVKEKPVEKEPPKEYPSFRFGWKKTTASGSRMLD